MPVAELYMPAYGILELRRSQPLDGSRFLRRDRNLAVRGSARSTDVVGRQAMGDELPYSGDVGRRS